ncbi:MAG TPA: transporter substrate-binding domain-containing protein [Fervidobacterium sp.]|nr:transporter substrate-binding domain-containing protein [Fervidobacterium sp.]HPT53296.1 transporter substrate-binding domain-containing protein [Fervidobacterium sp.]HPZ16908.1 transporter substrate-binding domain-containing protein [Fervidobacterium sp.]HQE47779.1 transporter substrate-binding domain-containing protein [Fervidobacterium sp.]HUM41374.1 transporter substrate-binding domain-containing protein [Fervidobacterium sp.]
MKNAKLMKHVIFFLVFIIMLTALSTLGFGLRVGYYDDYPLCYSENGQPKGIFIEILKETFDSDFDKIEFVYGEFSSLLKMVRDGELDILTVVAHTKEREDIYSFNKESVIMNWGVLVSNIDIDSLEELAGKKIAVNRGDIYYETFKNMLSSFEIAVSYEELDTYFDVLEAVDSGQYIAGVVSRLSYMVSSENLSRTSQTPYVFSPTALKFASQRGKNLDLLEQIDNTIVMMKASGKITELFNSYFSVVKKGKFSFSNLAIGFLLGVLVAFVAGMLIFRGVMKARISYYKAAAKTFGQTATKQYEDEHWLEDGDNGRTTKELQNIIYNSVIGKLLLRKYMDLARRENNALSVITLEILNEDVLKETTALEIILSSFLKPGDFIFKLEEQRYVFVFYSYGSIFLEVFRSRVHELAKSHNLDLQFIIGYCKFNPNSHLDPEQMIYESIVEMEKERQLLKKQK